MADRVMVNNVIFSQLLDSIQSGYPEVYRLMDGSTRVANLTFIEEICRAYPHAMKNIGAPYHGYERSEMTTAWSTPYFRAIRNNIPAYSNVWDVIGRGYKYRDVIWTTLALIKIGADREIRHYRNLHRCMELTSDPSNVVFLPQSEIDSYNNRPRVIEEETRPAEVRPVTPSWEEPSDIPPAIPIPPGSDTVVRPSSGPSALSLLVIGGLALAAVLFLGDE